MKEPLFQEFPQVSANQWKQQIEADLKGADYDEKLVYNSLDGISVKPFYTSEDLTGRFQLPPPKPWNICEKITVEDEGQGNKKARQVLEKGAESLWFVIFSETIDPNTLFEGLELSRIPIYLDLQFLSLEYVQKLDALLAGKNAEVYLQTDILGHLSRTGNWYFDREKDFLFLKAIAATSNFRSVFAIDLSHIQNAGANIPQQLGFAMGILKEYLNIFSQKKDLLKGFSPQFLIAVGSNYFFEIAKLRALRGLYQIMAKEDDLPENCTIIAQPSRRDKTLYDNNVNLLRTTTQSMSAVLGGADAVYNTPYDAFFKRNSEFGERIARNQLLIMKHEAYFKRVANPADGAYYIESLTSQFTEAALEIYHEIEREGGLLALLLNEKIQAQIERSASKEQELFNKGELILVGTNKFTNPQDLMQKELEREPFKPEASGESLIRPILPKRLSEKQEQERLRKEQLES
ncbi:methylmalonyl-CoA mutase [Salinimicrobium sp. CDJ15-81-2]|nr:methylmalonyl-CoA mutase [Salinimicrobium nanhaiense]